MQMDGQVLLAYTSLISFNALRTHQCMDNNKKIGIQRLQTIELTIFTRHVENLELFEVAEHYVLFSNIAHV